MEQKTASGKTQVLEVSARRVSKQLSVEEQAVVATHRHHLHHPPEIIVPPENQLISLHSEIELTVKVRAAHGAKISWYHDGQKVAVTGTSCFCFFKFLWKWLELIQYLSSILHCAGLGSAPLFF